MDAPDPQKSLLAWLAWQKRDLFHPTFQEALMRLADVSRAKKRHQRIGTETFLRTMARLRDDAALRRLVQESGRVLDATRVWILLNELQRYVRRLDPRSDEYAAIHNRLSLKPSPLLACRICLERFEPSR